MKNHERFFSAYADFSQEPIVLAIDLIEGRSIRMVDRSRATFNIGAYSRFNCLIKPLVSKISLALSNVVTFHRSLLHNSVIARSILSLGSNHTPIILKSSPSGSCKEIILMCCLSGSNVTLFAAPQF